MNRPQVGDRAGVQPAASYGSRIAGVGSVAVLRGRRAVIAKLGRDPHWQGALEFARNLRDAGMEVVYLGHATADEVVAATRQAAPSVVALSSLAGAHLKECPAMLAGLRGAGLHDVAVVLDGRVPAAHVPRLTALGIDAVFSSGSAFTDKVRRVAELVGSARRELLE
jgi:methylmalonyl-CoA mutase, C-terminal domain